MTVLRTMLIIGATFDDARAFVGIRPGSQPGDLVDDDRPSLLVPESLWPTGEPFQGDFFGATKEDGSLGWPDRGTRPRYDAIVVTLAAIRAYAVTEVDIHAWCVDRSSDLLNQDGGWLYVQAAHADAARIAHYDTIHGSRATRGA